MKKSGESEPSRSREGSYEVGYRKPPEKHRFKPGKSGNPKGRPKGAKDKNAKLLSDIVQEEAAREILVNEGGEQRMIPTSQALVRSLNHQALKGDQRAKSKARQPIETSQRNSGASPSGPPIQPKANDSIRRTWVKALEVIHGYRRWCNKPRKGPPELTYHEV